MPLLSDRRSSSRLFRNLQSVLRFLRLNGLSDRRFRSGARRQFLRSHLVMLARGRFMLLGVHRLFKMFRLVMRRRLMHRFLPSRFLAHRFMRALLMFRDVLSRSLLHRMR